MLCSVLGGITGDLEEGQSIALTLGRSSWKLCKKQRLRGGPDAASMLIVPG